MATFFFYRIVDAIRTLVQGTPEEEVFKTECESLHTKDGEVYISDVPSAARWKRHENFVRRRWPSAVLGGVIMYADETTTNTIRGKKYYPIYISLANHEIGYRLDFGLSNAS
jgi:hypothetical protein